MKALGSTVAAERTPDAAHTAAGARDAAVLPQHSDGRSSSSQYFPAEVRDRMLSCATSLDPLLMSASEFASSEDESGSGTLDCVSSSLPSTIVARENA